jgi:hypothetical protein
MLHLLKLEFLKVKNYKPIIVMAILYLVLLPATLLLGKALPEEPAAFFGIPGCYNFPNIWKYMGYIGSWLGFLFLGFMGVLSITMEFGNKTLRQNIITGLSRKEYFSAKIVLITAISLIATAYYFLAGTVIGMIHADPLYMDIYVKSFNYLPNYFLMNFAYMSFGLFLGMLVRRTGFAIFLFLAYGIFLEQIIRGLHLYYFPASRSVIFYPLNAIEDLTPLPFVEMANDMVREMDFNPFLSSSEAMITVTIYTALFIFGAYRLMMKRDL